MCYAMRAKVNSSIDCTAHESSFLCVCSTAAAAATATARSDSQLGVFYLLSVWRRSNPHLLLERCLISFSNVPKKLKTAEFAADDNLGEQLAEIVGSADCAFAASGSPT